MILRRQSTLTSMVSLPVEPMHRNLRMCRPTETELVAFEQGNGVKQAADLYDDQDKV